MQISGKKGEGRNQSTERAREMGQEVYSGPVQKNQWKNYMQ